MNTDYASLLNEEQYAAVTTRARHALVIAGAGSGKTRTLTHRVSYLMEQGIAPWRILLLTFTNKASREMLSRVKDLAGESALQVWGGTFHSLAYRILRRHADLLGFAPNFTILDSSDQSAMMKAIMKQLAPKANKSFPKASLILSMLSFSRSKGISWQDAIAQEHPEFISMLPQLAPIYEAYAKRKRESNGMDFDDLLLYVVQLLEKEVDVRSLYQERFAHVLVDEYQDTNGPQERMISLLSGGRETSLMVVGDDAQSIYSWRGASVDHILRFEERYPDAIIFKVEINYRSVPAILQVSNAAIALNSCQFEKKLTAQRSGTKLLPAVVPVPDKRAEARFVASQIDQLLCEENLQGKDIAVLYRAHFHSTDLQMELSRNHIPFRITSGLRFFEQAHVKDLVAGLRLLGNPRDAVALGRVLMMFPRVGAVTAQKVQLAWMEVLDANPRLSLRGRFVELMASVKGITASILPLWMEFLVTMDQLAAPIAEIPQETQETQETQDAAIAREAEEDALDSSDESIAVAQDGRSSVLPRKWDLEKPAAFEEDFMAARLIAKLLQFFEPYIRASYENAEERLDDFQFFLSSLPPSSSLDEFLAEISLMSGLEEKEKEGSNNADDCITLSSIHQAKGLEWKVVFVLSLSDGMFPHYKVLERGDLQSLEEERRLFYVAVTRAEDRLYLLYPRFSGGYDGKYYRASRFLSSLPEDLVQLWSEE